MQLEYLYKGGHIAKVLAEINENIDNAMLGQIPHGAPVLRALMAKLTELLCPPRPPTVPASDTTPGSLFRSVALASPPLYLRADIDSVESPEVICAWEHPGSTRNSELYGQFYNSSYCTCPQWPGSRRGRVSRRHTSSSYRSTTGRCSADIPTPPLIGDLPEQFGCYSRVRTPPRCTTLARHTCSTVEGRANRTCSAAATYPIPGHLCTSSLQQAVIRSHIPSPIACFPRASAHRRWRPHAPAYRVDQRVTAAPLRGSPPVYGSDCCAPQRRAY